MDYLERHAALRGGAPEAGELRGRRVATGKQREARTKVVVERGAVGQPEMRREAARTGGEQVQAAPAIEGEYVAVDTVAARNAAEDYLSASGVTGTVTVTGGDTITVDVTDTYKPKFLSFIGIGDLTVTSTASGARGFSRN